MDWAKFYKNVLIAHGALKILSFIFTFIVGIVILLYINAPIWLIGIFALLMGIIIVLGIVYTTRIASVDLNEEAATKTKRTTPDRIFEGEKILGEIYGVSTMFRPAIAILGVGKVKNPENTIIITNHRVLFIAVPVPGGGKIVGRMDFSLANAILNRTNIETKWKSMLSSMTLNEILDSNPANYDISFDKIKEIKLEPFWGRGVIFKTLDGKKIRYNIYGEEDIEIMKKIFEKYFPEKLIKD